MTDKCIYKSQTKLSLYYLGGQWDEVYNYFTSAWDVIFDRLNQSNK